MDRDRGEIKNITEFGLFIGLAGEIDGMAHFSDLDWERPGEEAINDYSKGENVKAKVLDIDPEKERISLGSNNLQKTHLLPVPQQFGKAS